MKKLLIAVLIVMVSTGAAWAVGFDMTGMFYVRGSAISNETGLQGRTSLPDDDAVDYQYYDQELDLTARLLVNDQTRVIVNFEITDQNWIQGSTDGFRSDNNQGAAQGLTGDDQIAFKRVFGVHTFGNGTQFDFGLMTGGTWATSFFETGNGRWRLKAAHPFEFGKVFAIIEKNTEVGEPNGATDDAEDDDSDAYYLAMVTKLGDINVLPLIGYLDNGDVDGKTVPPLSGDQSSGDLEIFLAQLALNGTFGEFGFEAEFDYADYTYDQGPLAEDYSVAGGYVNGWMNIDAFKIGGMVAYGSYDDDGGVAGAGAGFGFGEDFTPTIFGADWATIGESGLSEYNSVTLGQIYVDYAYSEATSFTVNGTYWTSNSEDNLWEDADGFEIDFWMNYKISDAVTYTVAAAFGEITLDPNTLLFPEITDDPDSFYRAYHRIKISF